MINENCKISIIMPVYNSERFLNDMIQNILEQTFSDFELLLIDDGSIDNSGDICDKWAEKDERVKSIHQENQGITKTRNIGLINAKGQYVMFVDNDDLCKNTMLEDNYLLAIKYKADVVKFGAIQQVLNTNNEVVHESIRQVDSLKILSSDKEFTENYSLLKETRIINTVWNGLYRRELLIFRQIQFREDMYSGCDDQIFNLELYRASSFWVVNPKCYYYWIQRISHSTTNKYCPTQIREACWVLEEELKTLHFLSINENVITYWKDRMAFYLADALLLIVDDRREVSLKEMKKDLKGLRHKNYYKEYINLRLFIYLLKKRDKKYLMVFLFILRADSVLLKVSRLYSRYMIKMKFT